MSEIVEMPVDTPEDLAEAARSLSQFVREVILSRDPEGNWSATYERAWVLDAQPAGLLADLLRGRALRESLSAQEGLNVVAFEKPLLRLPSGEVVQNGTQLRLGELRDAPPMIVTSTDPAASEVEVAWFNRDLMLIKAKLPASLFTVYSPKRGK